MSRIERKKTEFTKCETENSFFLNGKSLALMLLKRPSIKNQMAETTSPTALAIAQIIKFNSVKHKRGPGTGCVRHSTTQEIPVPLYVGLMLHAHTHTKELTSTVNSDGEQRLQASSKVVCPPLQFLYSSIPPMLGKRLTE